MKCWILWHGGSSYAHGYVETDAEVFESISELKRAFDARADSWNTYYPGVDRVPAEDGGPSAYVFFYDPNDPSNGPGDPYPDRVIEFGPRGGVRVTPC